MHYKLQHEGGKTSYKSVYYLGKHHLYSGGTPFDCRPEHRYPNGVFRCFPQYLQANAGVVPLLGITASFQIHSNSLILNDRIILRCTV
jgi:hypothetical protein